MSIQSSFAGLAGSAGYAASKIKKIKKFSEVGNTYSRPKGEKAIERVKTQVEAQKSTRSSFQQKLRNVKQKKQAKVERGSNLVVDIGGKK